MGSEKPEKFNWRSIFKTVTVKNQTRSQRRLFEELERQGVEQRERMTRELNTNLFGDKGKYEEEFIKKGDTPMPVLDIDRTQEITETPTTNEVPLIMNVKETAILLRVSAVQLYKLIKRNDIPYFSVGKSIRFNLERLEQWMLKQEIK